jgi:hypothetical protein
MSEGEEEENAPISTSARQHLVDTDDMEGVGADTKMERILAGCLGDVLVGANTGGFEGFGRELFVLVGNKVGAEGELVDVSTFTTEIKNTDLWSGLIINDCFVKKGIK